MCSCCSLYFPRTSPLSPAQLYAGIREWEGKKQTWGTRVDGKGAAVCISPLLSIAGWGSELLGQGRDTLLSYSHRPLNVQTDSPVLQTGEISLFSRTVTEIMGGWQHCLGSHKCDFCDPDIPTPVLRVCPFANFLFIFANSGCLEQILHLSFSTFISPTVLL